jgi:hypothetical protein
MTLGEAARQGIRRVRRPMWADPQDYMRIHVASRHYGPCGELFARRTQEAVNEPTPQRVFILGDDFTDYEPYAGPLDRDDTE